MIRLGLRGVKHELKGTGVSVTCFCPTMTKTLFFKRASIDETKALKNKMLVMDAATAARLGYKALQKGKTTTAAGLTSSLLMFWTRFMPRSLACSIMNSVVKEAVMAGDREMSVGCCGSDLPEPDPGLCSEEPGRPL